MRLPRNSRTQRHGGTLVELAVVMSLFLLLLFGIIEYGRLIFTQQVMINASREGARYAVVNTTDTNLVTDTQTYVKTKMATVNTMVSNYTCLVYAADSTGANIGTPTTAQFGQLIAVQIDCDYTPIVPNLLKMNSSMHLTYKALMYSEAN